MLNPPPRKSCDFCGAPVNLKSGRSKPEKVAGLFGVDLDRAKEVADEIKFLRQKC